VEPQEIRSAPIETELPYTGLQKALLQANVEPLYTADVRAFQAKRLREELSKLDMPKHGPLGLRIFLTLGTFVLSGFGSASILLPFLRGWHGAIPIALIVAAGCIELGVARAFALLLTGDVHDTGLPLAWRTYQVGWCAAGVLENFTGDFRGEGLQTRTIIPGEIQYRIRAIADTGVSARFSARFSAEQLDIDPFVWVSHEDESYCIGQFDEKGFVR
jgi:hypothetical protein